MEELIGLGQVWTLEDGSYCVTHKKTLVEFVSADPARGGTRLRDFHDQHGFSAALVKSYDHDLVRSFNQLGWTAVVGGLLFRKRRARYTAAFDGAKIRAATSADLRAIWQINDTFFDSREELDGLLGSASLWTVTIDGGVAGCGLTNRINAESDAVDVGMMVAPSFRRRGLGTHIVSELCAKVESQGLRPVCGCAADNIASRATLEKAGFLSEHQLLRFTP